MAASTAIDPALVGRFKAALDRLNPEGGTVGLAVSGGPDSMAMLLLACETIPGQFEAATIDHGLRPEAKDECALVAAACAGRGVPCEVLPVHIAKGNVQAEARAARYAALAGWAQKRGLAAVATAHHADDQAETLLMRLNRGSGVAGLAGVRARQWHPDLQLTILRPLLGFSRAELGEVIARSGQVVASDPSNADPSFDRVRMRQALADCDWLDRAAIARSAGNLAEAYEALQDYAQLLWPQLVRRTEDGFVLTPGPSREMNRRLLAQVMQEMGGRPRGGDVARLLTRLERGEGGNVAGVLAKVVGDEWDLRPEPPRRAG